jgi:hypothetical protein
MPQWRLPLEPAITRRGAQIQQAGELVMALLSAIAVLVSALLVFISLCVQAVIIYLASAVFAVGWVGRESAPV